MIIRDKVRCSQILFTPCWGNSAGKGEGREDVGAVVAGVVIEVGDLEARFGLEAANGAASERVSRIGYAPRFGLVADNGAA